MNTQSCNQAIAFPLISSPMQRFHKCNNVFIAVDAHLHVVGMMHVDPTIRP